MSSTTKNGRRLLVSYAHPDDESFGLGGTISRYTRRGTEVRLICATNGELGTIDPEYLEGFASPAERRLHELDCAASQLGLSHVYKFGYRDSGMMGSEDNNHPNALWQADQGELARKVTAIIREFRPQVVVTFDPYGGYGHPDHIAIHRATVQAFHEAGDPEKYPEQIANGTEPYQPQKLYFTIFPRIFVRIGVWLARLRGQDPRRMGRNHDFDMVAVLDAELPWHTRLDLRDYYDDWQAASNCHVSQQSPRQTFPIPRSVEKWLFGKQTFYRAWPRVKEHRVRESDLFEGVIE